MTSRLGFGSLAAGVGLLVLSTNLMAQTMAMPVLPPETEPEPAAEPGTPPPGAPPAVEGKAPAELVKAAKAPVAARPRPQPWDYAVGAGVGWEHNIDFVRPGGPSSSALLPRGQIARNFWSPRAILRTVATGLWSGYPSVSGLNSYYTDFKLEGEYQSSARTSWRGDASYSLGDTDTSQVLLAQGRPLPLIKTRSFTTALDYSHLLARRTTLKVAGRFYRTVFDAPGFVDGESLRGSVSLDREFSPRNRGSIVYSIEDVLANEVGRAYHTHFGSFQFTRFLAPRAAILLEAGLSYSPDAAQVGLNGKESFFGGASYTRQVKRSNVTAYLRREVTPAFGFGVSLLVTRLGATMDIPVARDLRLKIAGYNTRPDKVENAPIAYSPYSDAFVILARRVGRQVEVSAETRYRNRGQTTALQGMSSYIAGLYVTFAPPGKTIPAEWGLY